MKPVLYNFKYITFFVAFILAIFALWNIIAVFLKDKHGQQKKYAEYIVLDSVADEFLITEIPDLPDLTPYTVEAIIAKKKPIKVGYTLVEKLEVGYERMRLRANYFAKLQERTQPLVITIADGVYDLKTLTREIGNPDLIEEKNGEFFVYVPITIRETGMLIIDNDTLKLSSTKGALINSFGDLLIINSTISGWNTKENKPAKFANATSFRPHIIGWCGSVTDIAKSTISHLGYLSSKAYGITYTSCSDTYYRYRYPDYEGGTGWLIDNVFDDIYYGFYSYEAHHIAIIENEYKNNVVYGIDPHDWSTNLIIAHNKIYGTKQKHGIIGSRGVTDSYIIYNQTENNKGSGIMLDRSSNHNVVAYNLSRNNGSDGMTFYESAHNISFKNSYINNKKSGIRVRNSWGIQSYRDVINMNHNAAVELYADYLPIDQYRDLMLDPYTEKAEASIIEPEMIGNKFANFKVKNFDQLILYRPKFYQLPDKHFSSEDSALSDALNEKVKPAQTEIFATKKSD